MGRTVKGEGDRQIDATVQAEKEKGSLFLCGQTDVCKYLHPDSLIWCQVSKKQGGEY